LLVCHLQQLLLVLTQAVLLLWLCLLLPSSWEES
jgi:hypothetical protein